MRNQTVFPLCPLPACKRKELRVSLFTRSWMRKGFLCSLLVYLGCTPILWALPFQNLDFESATVSNLPPNQQEIVSVTAALPGWTAYIGTNQITQVGHNVITLGAANVGVWGPNYGFGILPLQGSYSAIVQAGGEVGNPGGTASIAQMGTIPSSAKSMQFEGTLQLGQSGSSFTNSLFVTFGGQNTPVVPLGNNLYGCDVSGFAGSTENLEFTMSDAFGNALILLDAISFSTQAIPEPSGFSLVIVAVVSLGLSRLTSRKTA